MPTKRRALEELSRNVLRPAPSDADWIPTSAQPSKRARPSRTQASVSSSPPEAPRPAPATPSVLPPPPPPAASKPLLVFDAAQSAWRQFADDLAHGTGAATGNQSLPPVIRPLSDSDLAFGGQQLSHGHCWALYTRSRRAGGTVVETLKLREGGSNNDSPRTQNLRGVKGKVYNYHILAADRAARTPTPDLNIPLLRAVSREKAEDTPLTLLHLCGHKWCHNAGHFAVGTKRHNDGQTACHRGLQSAGDVEELAGVQRFFCKHVPKCWTMVYRGAFADSHDWE